LSVWSESVCATGFRRAKTDRNRATGKGRKNMRGSTDHSLIHAARTFITGDNVHCINTWLFCYEHTRDEGTRAHYEKLLRKFVAAKRLSISGPADSGLLLANTIRAGG